MPKETVRHADLESILAQAEQLLNTDNQYINAEQLVDDVLAVEPDDGTAQRLKQQTDALREDHERRLVEARKLMVRRAFQQALDILVGLQEDYPWDQRLQAEIDRCETRASNAPDANWAAEQAAPDEAEPERAGEHKGIAAPASHGASEAADEDETRAAALLDQARRLLLGYEFEEAIDAAERGLETGYVNDQLQAIWDQAREGLRRRAALMAAFDDQLGDSDYDAARDSLQRARDLGLDDESRQQAERELAEAIRRDESEREEQQRLAREQQEPERWEDDEEQRIVLTGRGTPGGGGSQTESYGPGPVTSDESYPLLGSIDSTTEPDGPDTAASDDGPGETFPPTGSRDSTTEPYGPSQPTGEPAGTEESGSGGGSGFPTESPPAAPTGGSSPQDGGQRKARTWQDSIRRNRDNLVLRTRRLGQWLLHSPARAFVVAFALGVVLTVIIAFCIFGWLSSDATDTTPIADEDFGDQLRLLRTQLEQDRESVSADVQKMQTSLTSLSKVVVAHSNAWKEGRAIDECRAQAMDTAIAGFTQALVALQRQLTDEGTEDSQNTTEPSGNEAQEDDPDTNAAAGSDALNEALAKLEEARRLLAAGAQPRTQQQGGRPEAAPHGCPPVLPCSSQDARIIVKLPPLAYTPTLTRQGSYAFANLFSAAAARGIENVTIRSMNAIHVCPTCKTTHAPDQPCPATDVESDPPPSTEDGP